MGKLEGDSLEWEIRAWERDPTSRTKALVAAGLAGLAGVFFFHSVALGVIGAAVILFSTAELFLPQKFKLTAASAQRRLGFSVTEIRWEDVKRLIPIGAGVRLSPLEKASRLDEFRGLLVVFSGNEEVVWAKIREFWQGDECGLAGSPGEGGGGEDHP